MEISICLLSLETAVHRYRGARILLFFCVLCEEKGAIWIKYLTNKLWGICQKCVHGLCRKSVRRVEGLSWWGGLCHSLRYIEYRKAALLELCLYLACPKGPLLPLLKLVSGLKTKRFLWRGYLRCGGFSCMTHTYFVPRFGDLCNLCLNQLFIFKYIYSLHSSQRTEK